MKSDLILSLRTELDIRDSGEVTSDTAMVFRFGLMVPSMMVNGRITKLMAKEHSGMFMETDMRVSGREIRLMVTELIPIATVPLTRATGEMIYNTVRESNIGTITQNMMESTTKVKSITLEPTHGKMDHNIKDNGLRIEFTEKESTLGTMVDNMMVNGKITIWMVLVFTLGKTVGNMKDNTRRTRNMERVSTPGLMEESTMVSGKMVASTVGANTSRKLTSSERVYGRMAKEKNGSMNYHESIKVYTTVSEK